MAKSFTTWTVLPHDPIEKLTEGVWTVSGKMPGGNQRRMTLARRADGTLVIHNPIALDDAEMQAVEALGKPAYLVVPNGFHRQDSFIYKQRYPQIFVVCPQGARKKVGQVVKIDGHLDEVPRDADVEVFHLRGMKEREGAIRARGNDGVVVIFNDAVLNMAKASGMMDLFLAPTGTVSVPRFARWFMMKSGAGLKQHLEELAASPNLTHVVPGHGDVVARDAAATLKQAAARL